MKTFVTVIATDYQTYNVNGDRAWRTFKDFMLRLLAALDEKATEHGPNASDIEISGQRRWNLYCVAPKVPQRTYTGSGKANSRNISVKLCFRESCHCPRIIICIKVRNSPVLCWSPVDCPVFIVWEMSARILSQIVA